MALNKNKILTLIGTAVLFSAFVIFAARTAWCAAAKGKYEWQKGMCYTTWSKERYSSRQSDESLEALAKTGTKWVSILTTWYQEKCYTTKIFPTEKSPSDESLIHAINKAHSLGMKVMLKPHLDIIDTSEGSWRGEIACISEPDWNAWFESYRDFILHYAKIAQENKVEIFCIGTELTSVATIRGDMWKGIVIKPVRNVYKGPLTYAANWNVEYMHVSFWDEMDYLGIDAYFPLSEKDKPTPKDLKKCWEQWVKEIEDYQKKVNKPVIFPEVGYCSGRGAAKQPWEEVVGGEIDLELQANCYRALLEAFWNKSWFYGAYWWRWGTDTRFGGRSNRGFSPQNKPSQDVVKEWYRKSVPKR